MVQCFVPDCNQRSENTSFKFFRFPKYDRERKRWVDLIRRQDREPRDADRVCSFHFVNGEKSAGPTIFQRNEKKRFEFSSPEKERKRKRLVFASDNQENVTKTPQTPLPNADEFLDTTPVHCNPVFSRETMNIFIANLEEEVKMLTEELKYLKLTFSYEHIKNNDELVTLYTGLPNATAFDCLYDMCSKFEINYYYEWKVEKIRKKDQLLMTLMKLRRNDPQLDMATRFSVSRGTVQNIIFTWIHVLYEILFVALMKNIPSREKNQGCLP